MLRSENSTQDEVPRRRGRPAGKNRIPLTLHERRARNAQYERERRTETAEAMYDLADAAGCDPSISNAELLATVITQLQRASEKDSSEDLDRLRRCNDSLMMQINILEERLRNDPSCNGIKTEQQSDLNQQPEVTSSAPQIGETSFQYNTTQATDRKFMTYRPKRKIKVERLPGKRCLSSSSESDNGIQKLPKLKIIKTERGLCSELKSDVFCEIKQESNKTREDSFEYGHSSRNTCFKPLANGIDSQMEDSKSNVKTMQFTVSAPIQMSIQKQERQSFQNEAVLPDTVEIDPPNETQLQSQELDEFPDMEESILSTWLESDDIYNDNDSGNTYYDLKWINEDILPEFTS